MPQRKNTTSWLKDMASLKKLSSCGALYRSWVIYTACTLLLPRLPSRGKCITVPLITTSPLTYRQRLLERRVNALLKVGQSTSKARNTKDFWARIAQAIEPYEYDFPVAVLYSQCELLDPPDSAGKLKGSLDRCTLEWTIGYKPDHPALPQHVHLDSDLGLARAMTDSAKGGPALLFKEEDGVLPEALYRDLEKRAFGDPIRVLLVVPIRTYDDTIVGYLLVGLNTRRPYDDEYEDWIKVFSNLLGASAASVALHEEEIRNRARREEQATRDREALSAEVATLTKEASHAAEKLRNFHDIADQVGLGYFEISVDGRLVHANVRNSTPRNR